MLIRAPKTEQIKKNLTKEEFLSLSWMRDKMVRFMGMDTIHLVCKESESLRASIMKDEKKIRKITLEGFMLVDDENNPIDDGEAKNFVYEHLKSL